MKFYNCKNDKCFKCVFLNPLNQNLLNILINEVTGINYQNIMHSNIEKNINLAVRRKYLDLLIDSSETIVNIEVNGFNKKYVHPRNTSFICDCYSNYTLVNKEYTEDKQIIQINFSYGINGDEAISKYMIMNKNWKTYVKNFVIYEVNMDYCMSFWYNRNKQQVNKKNLENIIKYRYFIMQALNLKELNELINITHDERIVKYMEELKKVNRSPKFREYITEEQDKEFILNSVRNEGIVEGRAEGRVEGENFQKIQIARNMLNDKINLESISNYTGLSINQINSIKF